MRNAANNDNLAVCFLVLLLSAAVSCAKAQPPPDATDPYRQYNNLSPSVAAMIVVLMAALFFTGFFSIYLRHCNETPNVAAARPAAVGQRATAASRGLDSAVLETFPTFAYSDVKGLKYGKGALECAVCLNEFEDEDTLRLLPRCDHVFHPECIDAWLSSHITCPVCRANLALASDDDPVTPDIVVASAIAPIGLNDDGDSHELTELQNSVSIRVAGDDQHGDGQTQQVSKPVDRSRSMNQNRGMKSRSVKSLFFSRFPRSHSTGHSLVQPGENVERFTLRLPEDVRKQIMSQRLNRTTSLLVLPRETSSRRGYRTGEGSSRGKSYRRLESLDQTGKSDQWVFSMVPPFLYKALSFKSPKPANDGGEGTSAMPARGFITSLKKSFSRLNSKGTEPGFVTIAKDSGRPPV